MSHTIPHMEVIKFHLQCIDILDFRVVEWKHSDNLSSHKKVRNDPMFSSLSVMCVSHKWQPVIEGTCTRHEVSQLCLLLQIQFVSERKSDKAYLSTAVYFPCDHI